MFSHISNADTSFRQYLSIVLCLRVMLKMLAPYTTYGDDHKDFNLELSKLHLL